MVTVVPAAEALLELLHEGGDIAHAFQQGLAQDGVNPAAGLEAFLASFCEDSPFAIEDFQALEQLASGRSWRVGTRTRRWKWFPIMQ